MIPNESYDAQPIIPPDLRLKAAQVVGMELTDRQFQQFTGKNPDQGELFD
jgi:hypothetical protein